MENRHWEPFYRIPLKQKGATPLVSGGSCCSSRRSPAGPPRCESGSRVPSVLSATQNLAYKFGDLAAAQTGHVDVVAAQLALVVMTLAVDVHQIQLVDHALALQQVQGAVDGAAIDRRVDGRALRKIWLASRCLRAVSITDKMARRCCVMRIPLCASRACASGDFGLGRALKALLLLTNRKRVATESQLAR